MLLKLLATILLPYFVQQLNSWSNVECRVSSVECHKKYFLQYSNFFESTKNFVIFFLEQQKNTHFYHKNELFFTFQFFVPHLPN